VCVCVRVCVSCRLHANVRCHASKRLESVGWTVGQGCQHEAKVMTLWGVLETQVM
jgi:hypothetical protein